MLVLLPPSETKRPGGRRAPLDVDRLALPTLRSQREIVIDALMALSDDADIATKVLKLSSRQLGEIEVNAALRHGPTLPAVDRYTGVLYDALDAAGLDAAARRWLGKHILIHSAPFGPVGALDKIPAYRLGAAVAVPGLPPLRRLWADAVSTALAEHRSPFILDLRSEAYVALGPVPATTAAAYVRVVTAGADGQVRALNHFNKAAKGALTRTLAEQRPAVRSLRGLLRWAEESSIALELGPGGELVLHA